MDLGLFEFIIILVLIISVTEMATKILAPVARKLAGLLGEIAQEKREIRKGGAPQRALPPADLEALEDRLAAIEDRLDFIEELRAPDRGRSLTGGTAPRE